MQESDGLALGANSRLVVDETNTGGAAAIENGAQVIDDKTDVVDARTALGDELADG